MNPRLLLVIAALMAMLHSCTKGPSVDFSLYTEPRVEGLETSINMIPVREKDAEVWRVEVAATNTTGGAVTFKLVLSAAPHFKASRYLIPGVLYNGNEFAAGSTLSDGRPLSTAMPYGWEMNGEPWIFAGDRSSIPACTISENSEKVFSLFASDKDQNSINGSSSMSKLDDGSFRHVICWPATEAPFSYTGRCKFSPRYDTYITLEPGDSFTATAFACQGRPKWDNYGFTAVFPVAWRLLEHKTDAQHDLSETVRLDRASLKWSRCRNEEGSWFGESPDDTAGIGFMAQNFRNARVTIEYGLKDADADDVRFGIDVLDSWIRNCQMPCGLFSGGLKPLPGCTSTDAPEVGCAIGELSRTAAFLRENKEKIDAMDIDASATADRFEESASKVVDAVLASLPGDGSLGSSWDFSNGRLQSRAGDCGGHVLMGLVWYWKLTGSKDVRRAVDEAFDYYYTRDIDCFECCGGAADCSILDRGSIQPFFSAALEMWNVTKEEIYLERACKAGWYFLSWVYLQNPTYGPDTDIAIYNWHPAGAAIVGTERAAVDDFGALLVSGMMQLAKADRNDMWRQVAALMWRNGTQGFADSDRPFWHGVERPEGFKSGAWFPARWSKSSTGEDMRGSLDDHFMNCGGTCRLASLLELSPEDLKWLDEASRPCTQVILENAHGRALVDLRGANMRCWKKASVGGREVLGNLGIPIYWPWAIREGKPGCNIHGLTPYCDWRVKSRTDGSVVMELDDDDATRRVWPHRFHAEMEYTLGEELNVEFRVTNTDGHSYSCTELLHPFFKVSHPANCFIEGLDGSKYFWKLEAEKGSDRIWKGLFPVRNIAGGNPGIVFETGDGSYTLMDGVDSVTAKFRGGIKFVAYVAPEGSVAMETGTIYRDRAYTLEPGQTHILSLTISAK